MIFMGEIVVIMLFQDTLGRVTFHLIRLMENTYKGMNEEMRFFVHIKPYSPVIWNPGC